MKKMDEQERFTKFTQELAKLSLKYGVTIYSCGGVNVYTNEELKNGDLEKVVYSTDYSSGDLEVYAL
jgi:hypothetical protein